jgi:hypothetical protein
MPASAIFLIDMTLGYLAWAVIIVTYAWPRLRAMDRIEAHRAIAAFNSFRFFGLVFLLPGFVGQDLPAGWAAAAAYGDLATGLLAILALLTVRRGSLFWPFVWAFNVVGLADLVMDTVRASSVHLPSMAGQLGAAYAIPILYVPALLWMHLLAFRLWLRPAPASVRSSEAPAAITS